MVNNTKLTFEEIIKACGLQSIEAHKAQQTHLAQSRGEIWTPKNKIVRFVYNGIAGRRKTSQWVPDSTDNKKKNKSLKTIAPTP